MGSSIPSGVCHASYNVSSVERKQRIACSSSDEKALRISPTVHTRSIWRSHPATSASSSSQRHAGRLRASPSCSSESHAFRDDLSFACARQTTRKRQPSCRARMI